MNQMLLISCLMIILFLFNFLEAEEIDLSRQKRFMIVPPTSVSTSVPNIFSNTNFLFKFLNNNINP